MPSTISNKTFKSIIILLLAVLLLGIIIYFVGKFKSRPANINDSNKQSELLEDSIDNHIKDKITTDDKPKPENIVYKDKIVYRDKFIYKDTIIYKTSPPKTVYQDNIVYKDKVIYKDKIVYQDKIVYRDKPEPYHRYGKGNCKILIYTSCSKGGTTKVWIDGDYAGSFNVYLASGQPSCDDKDFVSLVTMSGKHHIKTRDDSNATTDFYITVGEDECNRQRITCN